MEYQRFIEWIFYGVISGVAVHGVRVLAKMGESIDSLNAKMAVVLERQDWHGRELEKQDNRITRLEERA
jgi:hypothetical protein